MDSIAEIITLDVIVDFVEGESSEAGADDVLGLSQAKDVLKMTIRQDSALLRFVEGKTVHIRQGGV